MQHRWVFCAPIHTNNIGRNDIELYNRKEPQLHLQNFCMGISQRIIILPKKLSDVSYGVENFANTSLL